jgi:hypothetical protein
LGKDVLTDEKVGNSDTRRLALFVGEFGDCVMLCVLGLGGEAGGGGSRASVGVYVR